MTAAVPIPPVVLFDLDGTLLDSAPDLHHAMNELLADVGRAPVPLDSFRRVVSRGGLAMLAQAFPDLQQAERDGMLGAFLDRYSRAIGRLSRAFEGVEPVLDKIESQGSRWGIVTNKPGFLAEQVIESVGWSARCAVLVAGDTLPVKKPDPAPLHHACQRLSVEVEACVYVGDDERDIIAARAAGMRSVAVLWGYRSEQENPLDWRSDSLIAHPDELLAPGVLVPA